jgi:hypothetical protein
MKNINRAMIESYARNLAGQVFGAMVIVSQSSGQDMPFGFGQGEWLLVANALWASFIPVAIRYVNKKDPAFGLIATKAAEEVSKRITATAKKTAKKAPAKKSSGGGAKSARNAL